MGEISLGSIFQWSFSFEAVERQIFNDLNGYEQSFKTDGVGNITAPDEPTLVITGDHARRLLEAMLSHQLVFLAASQTADCLMMSDNSCFADDAVAETMTAYRDNRNETSRAKSRSTPNDPAA